MSKAHPPELKKFMDKKLSLKLNGGRHVQGILRGFDPFMNLVVDDSLEMGPGGQQNTIGMVVSTANVKYTIYSDVSFNHSFHFLIPGNVFSVKLSPSELWHVAWQTCWCCCLAYVQRPLILQDCCSGASENLKPDCTGADVWAEGTTWIRPLALQHGSP